MYFPRLYELAKAEQKKLLHDSPLDHSIPIFNDNDPSVIVCPNPCHAISCTTDCWSGPDHESYICVTAHWLDKTFTTQKLLLDIALCTDRHTSENLSSWIKELFGSNHISVSLLRCFFVNCFFIVLP